MMQIAAWSRLEQIAAMHMHSYATKRSLLLPTFLLNIGSGAGEHVLRHRDPHSLLIFPRKNRAGEGI
jgi:hypothetical protein